ncbi:hypothetical protein ANN_12620 [Periplaneta americana]|uniref:Uncharacterized protein n=1 Tax=Periplaneta americana TaxID=6978 RepID=A0ABQ8THN3_PERAM|nr:hypothetical protein ANN_12620 [Periplaneta americana]
MVGLCEGGNEPPGSLKASKIRFYGSSPELTWTSKSPPDGESASAFSNKIHDILITLHYKRDTQKQSDTSDVYYELTHRGNKRRQDQQRPVPKMTENRSKHVNKLFNEGVSTIGLFSVNRICNREVEFSDVRIRHRLPHIRLTVRENLEKTNQVISPSGLRTHVVAQLQISGKTCYRLSYTG